MHIIRSTVLSLWYCSTWGETSGRDLVLVPLLLQRPGALGAPRRPGSPQAPCCDRMFGTYPSQAPQSWGASGPRWGGCSSDDPAAIPGTG